MKGMMKMCYELLKDNMDKLEENYYISGYADSRFITHDLTESQIEERYSKITSIYDNLDPYKMNRYCRVGDGAYFTIIRDRNGIRDTVATIYTEKKINVGEYNLYMFKHVDMYLEQKNRILSLIKTFMAMQGLIKCNIIGK